MKYRSAKGTVIDIPDGLTPKQIAAIKADADAGYGTRAQQTANDLGKKLKGGAAPDDGGEFTTEGKSPAELQEMLKRAQAEIDKRGGAEKAPGYAARIQKIQAALGSTSPVVQPGPSGSVPLPDPGGRVSPGTLSKQGIVDPVKAADDVSAAETHDFNTNFNAEHPQLITDENGNTRKIIRHADGTVTVEDTAGGISKTFKDLAEAAASTFNGDVSRQRAEEATYGTLTKYYDRDMGREEEAAQQDLANRGIPYNPAAAHDSNTNDLYGKTIGAINEKFRGLKDNAAQQAVISGNQAYATESAARDSFLRALLEGSSTFGGKFGEYSNSTSTDTSGDTKDILILSADQYMKKYAIDKDTYIKKLALAKSGSGGSGSGASSDPPGFEITG